MPQGRTAAVTFFLQMIQGCYTKKEPSVPHYPPFIANCGTGSFPPVVEFFHPTAGYRSWLIADGWSLWVMTGSWLVEGFRSRFIAGMARSYGPDGDNVQSAIRNPQFPSGSWLVGIRNPKSEISHLLTTGPCRKRESHLFRKTPCIFPLLASSLLCL